MSTAIHDSVLSAIGNTPVVRLRHLADARSAEVLVKLEYFNPTGSYKDRMALGMIEGAERRGVLTPGMRVVEFTGGSTGSSLAMICAIKGYPFVAVSNDAIAAEKLNTMRAFGADLIVLKSEGGKLTPDLFHKMRATVDALRAEPNTFWTDQFSNTDALDGYMNIGRELFAQAGGRLDAYCGGVGTGGMLAGVSRALKAAGSKARIIALEPSSSPFMTGGRGGPHHVEGIAAFPKVPHLEQGGVYDEARAINEADARHMARTLAKREGIFAGTSTALNIVAALQLARELGPGKTVATVAVDTGLKYLAGDLFT